MKKLIRHVSIIIFVLIARSTTYAQELLGFETIESAVNQSPIPTSVFGYVTKNGKTETMAFGTAIWEGEEKVTADHIFRIASMTKAVTSVAAMQLVEQGLINLDDPLNDLMPEMVSIPILTKDGQLVENDDIITLRHLLTHTSGFGYEFIEKRLQNFNKEGWQFEDFPRMDKPGEIWRYGTSTNWVGKVVEKLSGKSLENYFRDHITGPLEMHSTWFNVPEEMQHLIVSYGIMTDSELSEYVRIPARKLTSFSGGGGLFSSPNDYLKFIHCILNEGVFDDGCILSPKTVKQLFSNELADNLYLTFSVPEDGFNPNEGVANSTDRHSLAWALAKGHGYGFLNNDTEVILDNYRKGIGYWSGIYNTYFSINPNHGYGTVSFHQFLPYGDEDAIRFYLMFEQEVQKSIVQEKR